jgi:DNA-binding GntR family transcriptional regulator
MSLNPVASPTPLDQLAYDAIKEAILSFQLAPGQSIVESDLAKQLGMSKTPVRDAISRLEKEGLVVKIAYKGAFISDVSRESVQEIYQLRAVLEGLAASLATPNMDVKDRQYTQQLIQDEIAALNSNDIPNASRINRLFHDLLIEKSGNQWLKVVLANLDDHLQRYRMLSYFQQGRLKKSIREHQRVLDAILTGAPEAAEAGMKAHLLSVAADLTTTHDFDTLVQDAARRAHDQPHTSIE